MTETFAARWIGAVLVPADKIRACSRQQQERIPARLRVSSFGSDGTVRLHNADGDRLAYTCSTEQLQDAIRYGVLVPEGTPTETRSIRQLASNRQLNSQAGSAFTEVLVGVLALGLLLLAIVFVFALLAM